jgi:hypothetical protein
MKQRYDSAEVKAKVDENGFLVDEPIVARVGLQIYQTPTGERREFRPADEVFKADSLSTYQGKPITLGHVTVNADNAKDVVVGACSGAGKADGIGVRVPLTIYDKKSIEQAKAGVAGELSVGYTTTDIEQPGWGNESTGEYVFKKDSPEQPEGWVEFDAVQTNIRVNHIAMVYKGRAGIAKLRLDGEQESPYNDTVNLNKEDNEMFKIKMDGVEVEVSAEVKTHIEKLDGAIAEAKTKADTLEAERDALKEKVDGIDAKIAEAVEAAKADMEALAELKAEAVIAGVKCDGLDAKGIKVAYVKEVAGKDVSEKSDAYIDAAFDFAKEDGMAEARKATTIVEEVKQDSADGLIDPRTALKKLIK